MSADFDGRALYAAMDEKRRAEGLGAEKPDHPIAVATIRNLDRRGNPTSQFS